MKTKMKSALICLILTLGAWSIRAQEPADTVALQTAARTAPQPEAAVTHAQLWDRANTAYINADYRAAIDAYNRILDSGVASAKLYYNLANAYFKDDRLGPAILSYKRALRLAPGDEDIRYNLEVAQARTKDNIEAIPEFFVTTWVRALRHTMGCTAWSIVSLIALGLMFACFLMYLLSPRLSLRKTGFYGTMAAFVFCVVTMCFAAAERSEMLDESQAVVIVASTAVKSSPDKSATDLFLLHEGTELTVTNRLDDWCEVVIADGKKGWVECRKIETI